MNARRTDEAHGATQHDLVVVGRANIDITVMILQRAKPGRTTFASAPATTAAGGKSLNQVIAAARAGARAALVGNAGDDGWGRLLRTALKETGVDVDGFRLLPSASTGMAIIEVTPDGENHIVLALPPETELTADHVKIRLGRIAAPIVVTQLDLAPDAVEAVIRHHRAATLIGNLVPHPKVGPAVLAELDIFVGNEHEAAAILGQHHEDPLLAANELRRLGASTAIVTAGSRGAAYSASGEEAVVAAEATQAVNTTGAGDAFLGAFATYLGQGVPLSRAVEAGVRAGTGAVKGPGTTLLR